EGSHEHESVAVGSELVDQSHDQRSADPPSTISSMDRQPRDLRGLRIWASDGQEAAHLAVDLRDEPRLGSHGFRALPDTFLSSEPVGKRRDDRITGRAVARVEWSDHGYRSAAAPGPAPLPDGR